MRPKLLTSLFTACLAATAIAAPDDPALRGCWRSQQVQVTLADQSQRNQNGDCVTEYDAGSARTRCHNETGDVEIVYRYEVIEPGRLRITVLDSATGQPKGPASELRYSVDEDWLLVDRPITAAPPAGVAPGKQPVTLKAVSVRVRAEATAQAPECKARGANALRIGRTPVSSLALSVPPGWEPWLVDPSADQRLGPAVNASLFVGAFVPRGARTVPGPRQLVLVVDDVRPGPRPVRAAEFVAVKKRFAAELQPAKLTCDLQDRACALLSLPNGSQVYTELFNVKGRVAMVSGSVAQSDANSPHMLRQAVKTFVEQLRADNSK